MFEYLKLFAGIEPKYEYLTIVDQSMSPTKTTSHEVNMNFRAGINIGSMKGTHRLLIGGKYLVPLYNSIANMNNPDESNWICSFNNNSWQWMIHYIQNNENNSVFKVCADFGGIKKINNDKKYYNVDISLYYAFKFTLE